MYTVIFFFFCAVDRTSVHIGHTTVTGRPMDRRDALGVDIVVFKHGVYHERFNGGGGTVQSEEERHLNAPYIIYHANY